MARAISLFAVFPDNDRVFRDFIPVKFSVSSWQATSGYAEPISYSPKFVVADGDTFEYVEDLEEGWFSVVTWTLHLDLDDCERQKITQQCERERADITEACKTLEDWMVVSSVGEDTSPVISCATSDCSAAIQANESRGDDPFTSITKTLDKQCDNTEPVLCSLECFGWSP